MKKIVLISAFLVSTSMMFGQFTVHYNGSITNYPATAVMMYLEVDSVIVDSTLTNITTGNYTDSVNVATRPFLLRILFYDCHGTEIYNSHFTNTSISSPYTVSYPSLNYCNATGCNASFSKFQAFDPISRLPIPNKVILVDASTGNALTYSWDFGDGSAPLAGLNVTHTYATHGSYNICLTVVGTTPIGTCTSTFCDTLTVDSSGNVRSAFTVTTGESSLSIEENKSISGLKLYPNPVKEFITLDFESINAADLTITIFDTKGSDIQIIDKNIFSGSNKIQINTTGLQEGLYIIKLQDGKSFVTKRFQVVN